MKPCSKCSLPFSLEAFVRNKNRKTGFESTCKSCRINQTKAKQAEDPEGFALAQAKRKHRYNRSIKGQLASKKNHQKFHEKELIYGREFYNKNREKRIANTKRWQQNNIHRVLANNKQYRLRQSKNPIYVFSSRIRTSLRKAWTGSKSKPTFQILGYTRDDLFNRLNPYLGNLCERCNLVILTLKNTHIDHIIPLVVAITNEDVVKLNQLVNLRLICWLCNQKKGNKIEQFNTSSGSVSSGTSGETSQC